MVPTRYGRQAILDEFGGLKMCSTSASIDSNRVVDAKFLLIYVLLFVYHTSPSFMYSCRSVSSYTVDSVIWSSRTSN